jgi:hypothetical protein
MCGIATRKPDGTLNHQAFILIYLIPQAGSLLAGREVVEVLTDEELLKERSCCALNPIDAVAVLGSRVATD